MTPPELFLFLVIFSVTPNYLSMRGLFAEREGDQFRKVLYFRREDIENFKVFVLFEILWHKSVTCSQKYLRLLETHQEAHIKSTFCKISVIEKVQHLKKFSLEK